MHPRDDYPPPGSLLSRWLSSDCEESTLHRAPGPTIGVEEPVYNNSLSKSSMLSNKVSPEEYASLPLSIQRKYFSSVERLRIAQESAVQSRKKGAVIEDPCLSHRPSADVLRPQTARNPSLRVSASTNTLAARRSRSDSDVDEHQALRFLALPSKVKRTHFTQEELALLIESSERVLGWAALHATRSNMNLSRHGSVSSSRCLSSDPGDCIQDMEKDRFETKTESIHSLEHADSKEVSKIQKHNREGSLASTVDSSRPRSTARAIQQPASRYNKPSRRRRGSIFAPLPLPPPTLLPVVPSLPSPTHPKMMGIKTETKYYKDTDARSKLREFLTSPARFDEALEFGFPERRTTSTTPSVEPSPQSEVEELSVSHTQDEDDDDDDDEDEDEYMSGPRTPSVVTDGYNPRILHNSLDSGVALPLKFARGKGSIRSLSPDFEAGRSMTLKMTLTRSDLRAPEDKLYSIARMQASGVEVAEADPLALDPLPVCDDHTGAQGAFAVAARTTSGGGFKKVWNNLRGL